jgi:hypothetical protein
VNIVAHCACQCHLHLASGFLQKCVIAELRHAIAKRRTNTQASSESQEVCRRRLSAKRSRSVPGRCNLEFVDNKVVLSRVASGRVPYHYHSKSAPCVFHSCITASISPLQLIALQIIPTLFAYLYCYIFILLYFCIVVQHDTHSVET